MQPTSVFMAFYHVVKVEDWTCTSLVEYYSSKMEQKDWKKVLDWIKKDLIKVKNSDEFDIIRREKAREILDKWKDWTASYNDLRNLSGRAIIDQFQIKNVSHLQLTNLTGDSLSSTQNFDNRRTTLAKRHRDKETERAPTQLKKKTLSSGSSMEGPDIRNYFSRTRSEQDKQDKRPRTPEHRIYPSVASGAFMSPWIQECDIEESHVREFSDSDNGRIYDINDDINDNVNEDKYLEAVHLSQKTSQVATEEVRKIVEKIKRSKYRLFEYRVVNLSERNISNPVNQLLTEADKQLLRTAWVSLESSKEKTILQDKCDKIIKPLLKNYQKALVPKSVFDDFPLDLAIENVTERPYTGTFNFKQHHDLLWVQDLYKRLAPINVLLDPKQNELSYRENFVNPILAKLFDDIMDIIRVKTGEIENISNKTQRNETRQYLQRVSIGCSQDGIYEVDVNAATLEIGFLEVVGNALIVDIKKLNDDLNKVLKAMQISLFYQRQHHVQRGAKENQLTCLESYGIIVYQRTFTFYVMHNTCGGLYVVDRLMEFSIPNSKDQLYTLVEVVEKVYMFKSRIMDYYSKIQKITPNSTQTNSLKESPLQASPSKKSKRRSSIY